MREKTKSLKATHLPALPFLNNGCLSDFLPPFIPFHMIYKYWQNLPALVKVSLHLFFFFFFFWVQNFYAHESLFFFSFVCVCVYIRRVEPPCFGCGISISQSFFFLVQNYYALFILIWDPFFSFVCVCVCVYIRQASLAYHWCVCEIA